MTGSELESDGPDIVSRLRRLALDDGTNVVGSRGSVSQNVFLHQPAQNRAPSGPFPGRHVLELAIAFDR